MSRDELDARRGFKMAEKSNVYVRLPSWIAFWLALSSLICTIDALFVLLRPRTLPGGDLNYVVRPYNLYIEIDKRYLDLKDGFIIGQSWMNLLEVFFNICTLILNTQKPVLSVVLALIASTMTCSKTVLYFVISSKLCHGDEFITQTSWPQYLLLYVIPNGIWIMMPLLCIIVLVRKIIVAMEMGNAASKQYKAK